ncbi:hypothetical protein FJ987_00365 [Mesorhizobium sp. CU2]|uniref:hypothetical protein n=1 Tax=unclassified Mesorhizobium TaxID=325217 RepID=UPI00112B8375|nr:MULTISPECIES: hypothetical protein [unclassified Mesorhizobium]TPN89444.1 hypothetical protein FJ988_00555 [Mesorhizobium sp. CU3]TPO22191.1 hypothetical protein FJ987_00365 [Mesorhizobium sp. CU2]
MGERFSLAVPTRDGAPHSLIIAEEYRRLGIEVRYFVDSRSSPRYVKDVLRTVESATKLPIRWGASYVEGILPKIAAASRAKRMFRLDDDEFPSHALLTWLRDVAEQTDKPVIAVPRRAVAVIDSNAVFAANIPNMTPLDFQFRGFLVGSVKFRKNIHTAGFSFKEADILYAPSECHIYHFDWVVRSREQRADKLKFYEKIKPGTFESHKYQYLYEDFDPAVYEFSPLDDPDISALALRLYGARAASVEATEGWKRLWRRIAGR